jgi:hypothetical protein
MEKRSGQLGSPTYVIWCMLCSPAKEQINTPDFTLSACYFKFTLHKTCLLNDFWDVIGMHRKWTPQICNTMSPSTMLCLIFLVLVVLCRNNMCFHLVRMNGWSLRSHQLVTNDTESDFQLDRARTKPTLCSKRQLSSCKLYSIISAQPSSE